MKCLLSLLTKPTLKTECMQTEDLLAPCTDRTGPYFAGNPYVNYRYINPHVNYGNSYVNPWVNRR
jgi:hypothetical protein